MTPVHRTSRDRRSSGFGGAVGRALTVTLMALFAWAVLPSIPAAVAQDQPAPTKEEKDKKKGDKDKKDDQVKKDDKAKKDGDAKKDKKAKDAGKEKEVVYVGDQPAQDTGATAQEDEPTDGTPIAKVIEPTFDFGHVWAGPELTHTFQIKNEGDAPLKILSVKPACGCTTAGSTPDVIKPGETGDFPFKLKSASLAGSKEAKFVKTVTITTNDKRAETVKLTLTGQAQNRVDMDQVVNFGTVKADAQTERSVTITNNTDQKLELTMPETQVTPDSPFKYELAQKEEGKVYELKVVSIPPLKEGRINAELALKTNIPEQQELKTRISLNVPPRIQFRPAMVVYSPKRTTVPVTLTNNGPTDVKVLEATTDDPVLDVTVTEVTPGKNYTVQVKFPDDYTQPKGDRKLFIKTDDSEKGVIELPIKLVSSTNKIRPAEELVGKPAPEFQLTTADGKTMDNKTLGETPAVVLTFWAGDCPYCKKAMPRVDSLVPEFAPKGVRFINVAETMRKTYTNDELKGILVELKIKGELAPDQQNTVGPKFKASSYPTIFVLGKSGKVEGVAIGNTADLEKDLTKVLNTALGIKKADAKETGKSAEAPGASGAGEAEAAAGVETTTLGGTTTTTPKPPATTPGEKN